MGILGNFFKKTVQTEDSYLALVVTSDRVEACVWTFAGEMIETLGYSQKKFSNIDTLVHQAALVIDNACEKAKSDVTKTVFGLAHYWISDGKLTEEGAKTLKNLSEDLELAPQAYISLASAINHFYKVEEAVTPYAVLVGVFGQFCEVHLLANNQIVKSRISKNNVDGEKIKQLALGLKEGDKDLPPRIIVYGDEGLVAKIQKISWGELFVNDVKVEFLDDEKLTKSVAYAQAQDILGHEIGTLGSLGVSKEEKAETEVSARVNELGFVEGEDILFAKEKESEEFAGEKSASDLEQEAREEREEILTEAEDRFDASDFAVEVSPSQKRMARDEQNVIGQDVEGEQEVMSWLVKFLNFFNPSKKLFIGIILIALAVLIGVYVAGLTLTAAQVLVRVNPKNEEKNFSVDVALKVANESSQIAGFEVTSTAAGSQKTVAGGSKKQGDYAHGEINVLNWTPDAKTFGKGTVVINKNGLKFTLDSDVDVASRSAATKTPGQATVQVHAVEFGTNSNLDAGGDFTLQQYDELLYSAHNDSAFSGGNEKQVTVVAQADLDKLEKSLSESLVQKATESLKEKTGGLRLDSSATVQTINKKSFDKKVDEEASLVNLDMEVGLNAIVYKEDDLKEFLAKMINRDVSGNLTARGQDIDLLTVNAKRVSLPLGNGLALGGEFRARLIPKLAEVDLGSKIAGKSLKEARGIIRSIPEVVDVQVRFTPNLPFVDQLPADKSKIKFQIETQ